MMKGLAGTVYAMRCAAALACALMAPNAPARLAFVPRPAAATGLFPFSLSAGDVNNDGNADLVVAISQDATISIFLGRGDGTFRDQLTSYSGPVTVKVALADLNHDGMLDAVVVNDDQQALPKYVSVLLGKGDGTFQSPIRHAVDLFPRALTIADFDEDGIPDIAVATDHETVSLLRGRGNGDFDEQRIIPVGQTVEAIAAARLSSSGHLDLVLTSNGFDDAIIERGDGTGHFAAPTFWPVSPQPLDVVVADFDGDALVDIMTVSQGGAVDVLFGDGQAGVRQRKTLRAGSISQAIATADFDANGYADAVVANSMSNTIGIYRAGPHGRMFGPAMVPTGDYPNAVVTADFNNDGRPDVAVLDRNGGDVMAFLNLPDDLFANGFESVSPTY